MEGVLQVLEKEGVPGVDDLRLQLRKYHIRSDTVRLQAKAVGEVRKALWRELRKRVEEEVNRPPSEAVLEVGREYARYAARELGARFNRGLEKK